MKKVLFLQDNTVVEYVLNFSSRNIKELKIDQSFVNKRKMPRILIRAIRNLPGDLVGLSLENWHKSAKEYYDYLIIIESDATKNLLKYIDKLHIAKNKVLYYINSVNSYNEELIDFGKRYGFRLATYCKEDAKKYNMEYFHQFWNKELASNENIISNSNEVYFVGRTKNRYNSIIEVKKMIEKLGFETNFKIISDNEEPYTQKEEVNYLECITEMGKARTIVDIVGEGNYGLTWRPMEAMFLKKKLITNYRNIVDYGVYADNKKNIFVLGIDDINELFSFLNSPYINNSFDEEKYDIENWIRQICYERKEVEE